MRSLKIFGLIAAIIALFFSGPALASYNDIVSDGLTAQIEPQYGPAAKIRMIHEKEDKKESETFRGCREDIIIEISYKKGAKVTIFDQQKRVERTNGDKRIEEIYERYAPSGEWKLFHKTVTHKKNDHTIKELYNYSGPKKGIAYTTITSMCNGIMVWNGYNGDDYRRGRPPQTSFQIKETIIYPKGTTRENSHDYFKHQGPEEIFPSRWYESIERKLTETIQGGKIIKKCWETKLIYRDREILRIESDSDPCDGQIDYRRETMDMPDGNYGIVDLHGDGKNIWRTERKITTVYLP